MADDEKDVSAGPLAPPLEDDPRQGRLFPAPTPGHTVRVNVSAVQGITAAGLPDPHTLSQYIQLGVGELVVKMAVERHEHTMRAADQKQAAEVDGNRREYDLAVGDQQIVHRR